MSKTNKNKQCCKWWGSFPPRPWRLQKRFPTTTRDLMPSVCKIAPVEPLTDGDWNPLWLHCIINQQRDLQQQKNTFSLTTITTTLHATNTVLLQKNQKTQARPCESQQRGSKNESGFVYCGHGRLNFSFFSSPFYKIIIIITLIVRPIISSHSLEPQRLQIEIVKNYNHKNLFFWMLMQDGRFSPNEIWN